MSEHSHESEDLSGPVTEKFRADILDSKERYVRLEPLYLEGHYLVDEEGNHMRELKGFGFHQHAKTVTVDMDGVKEEWSCDYVALDVNQLKQMMDLFNSTLHIQDKE